MSRDDELSQLIKEQIKDMVRGNTQYPEPHVVLSLDRRVRGGDGDWTVADYVDQDGRLVDTRGTTGVRSTRD